MEATDAAPPPNPWRDLAPDLHELRTPVSAILGYSNLLAQDFHGAPEVLEKLLIIRSNSEYLLRLVNQMMSRATGAQVEPATTARMAPMAVARDVVRLMRQVASDKGLGLTLEADGRQPGEMRGNEMRLRQLLINLIGNALTFTNGGGVRVVLSANDSPDGRTLRLSVIDTGVGMTSEQLARLFQPFVQVHGSSAARGGSGLGLATCRRLAKQLGGALTATSHPGQGSTFQVTLPIRDESDHPSALTSDITPVVGDATTALVGADILVADETADSQLLISVLLKKAGASVTLVQDARAAYQVALAAQHAQRCFRALLIDVNLAEGAEGNTIAALRRNGYDGLMVGIGGTTNPAQRERAVAAGCDAVLPKPLDPESLARLIVEHARAQPGRTKAT